MAGELGVAVVQIEARLDELERGLRDAEGKAREGGGFISNALSTALGFGLANIAGAITGAVSGAISTAGDLIGQGISSNAAFEQYETQFATLLGSTEAAQERMAELADFGARTPFELPGVVEADRILQSFGFHSQESADMFGFSGEEIRTIAGDVASGTGSSFQEMALLMGKFSAGATGEAIMRMSELGITNRRELADMGLEFSKSGQLLSPLPEAMEVVVGLMQDKYGGLMDEQSTTFEGMQSNLSDWKDNTLRLITAPIFEILKEKLAALLEFLGRPEVQAFLQGLADSIATFVGNAVTWFQETLMPILVDVVMNKIIPAIQQFAAWFRDVLLPAVRDVWAWMSGTLIPFLRDTVAPIIGTVITAAISFLATVWTTVLKPAIETVWAWMSETLIPFLQNTVFPWLQEHIPAALETLRHFWEEVLKPGIEKVWEWLSGTLIPFLVNVLGNILEVVIPAAIEILRFAWENILKPAIEKVWEFLSETVIPFVRDTLVPWLQEKIPEAIETLREFWEEKLLPAITTIWEFIRDDLIPIFEDIWSFIKDDLAPAIETFVTGALDTLKNAWNGIKDAVQFVIDKIQEFKDWIAGLELPDWLTPGSPTPFEIALLGIADALGKVNDGLRETGRSMSALEMARLGAGIAGTGLSWQETNVPFLFQNPGGPGAAPGTTVYGGMQVVVRDDKDLMELLQVMQAA